MQIKPYTGRSIILMILILLSPYPFCKYVIFVHEFVKEFFTNVVHECKYEIHTNSYEFFAQKIGYVMNGLYCINVAGNSLSMRLSFV